MDNEQLITGLKLDEEIAKAERELEFFRKADNSANISLSYSDFSKTVGFDIVDFQTLKRLVISSYEKKLKNLRKQFAAL